ncbi:MAG: hypothetical protein HOB82_08285 [Alphaproteobacteria bacterium]|nr:hypothetical protein [Alphaproteobacteria bacterium]MBT4711508.1 hypothetical protein [Alphaproteobacteria bacterium]MBT5861111.1 hypothetical protein [Alphaproteobacteria bacterium]
MDKDVTEAFESLARQVVLDMGPMIDSGGLPGGRALDVGGGAQIICFLADQSSTTLLWRVRISSDEWVAQIEATTEAGQDRRFGSVDGIVPKILAVAGPSVRVVGDRPGAVQWIRAHGQGAAISIGKQVEAVRKRKTYEQTIVYGLAVIGAFALLRMLF